MNTDKTKPTIERRINNLRAISANQPEYPTVWHHNPAGGTPSAWISKDDYDSLQSEIEQIHTICLNVADCPPIAESDTRTVRYVKDMAHTIKNHEHYINAMQRNSQDTNTADTVAVPRTYERDGVQYVLLNDWLILRAMLRAAQEAK